MSSAMPFETSENKCLISHSQHDGNNVNGTTIVFKIGVWHDCMF